MSNKKSWSLEFGLYPGIMIGIRSYQEETQTESGGGSSEQEEETVENTKEQEEKEEEIYLEEEQENPDNVPWWIVIGRAENGDIIIKPNPEMLFSYSTKLKPGKYKITKMIRKANPGFKLGGKKNDALKRSIISMILNLKMAV